MKTTLLLILFSFTLSAATYRFGNELVAFQKIGEHVVSAECNNCQAIKMAQKFSQQSLSAEQLTGGKNPSSVRCSQYMQGTVVMGKDRAGNTQSFCVFTDGSYLR